jgi:hypothetical protein
MDRSHFPSIVVPEADNMGGNIEMSSRDGVMRHMETGSTPQTDEEKAPEPMAWARTRVRHQNRSFVVATAVFLIAAAVYVIGGLEMSQENSLVVENSDAQSGVVENDAENAKATEAFENAGSGTPGHATHGKPNPFGNNHGVEQSILDRHNVTTPHGSAIARWNRTHPGQPYPTKHHPAPHQNNTHQSNGTGNCEKKLSRWKDWMDKTITKGDGKQFEVLEQMDHDSKAFTYVYLMVCFLLESEFEKAHYVLVFSKLQPRIDLREWPSL